jgi:hypothetical protein
VAVSSAVPRRPSGVGADAGPTAVVVLRRDGSDVLLGPVYARGRCDLTLVDDLLRVQLAARRFGWCIRLRQVREDLRELIELAGLTDELVG